MKKSLVITDKDKYGSGLKPENPTDKPKERKLAPTITLTGKQVDAFCGCSLKVGDKGSATVHYVVKSSSSGDQYGDELPTGKTNDQKLVLALTHVESDEKGDDEEDESKEDPKEEADETPEEEAAEEKSEPAGEAKDMVSPKEALGDDY